MTATNSFDDIYNLNDLTVVIPTFNRPLHLKRLTHYFVQAGMGAKFLILDSSNADNLALNTELFSELNSDYTHVVYPPDLPVAQKLYKGLQLVKTTFCVLCADDDIIFPEALRAAKNFLQKNPSHICVDGIYLNFYPCDQKIQFQIEYGSGGIDLENPCDRVFRLLQKYESMFYAVFRTLDAIHLFSYVSRVPSLHYQELFQSVGVALKGKSHRLPIFFAGRQHGEPAQADRDNWQTYYWFSDDSQAFLDVYKKYRELLWDFFEECSIPNSINSKDFYMAMDLSHATFFSLNCPPEYFHSRMADLIPMSAYIESENLEPVYNLLGLNDEKHSPTGILGYFSLLIMRLHRVLINKMESDRLRKESKKPLKNELPWDYSLPIKYLWLEDTKEFKSAYLELNKYLGKPTP